MRVAPDSPNGKLLMGYDISFNALKRTWLYLPRWQPFMMVTIPIPFAGCVILIRQNLIDLGKDGEFSDTLSLAPLVHQFCHAHQRLEWGIFLYIWRHLCSRVFGRRFPVWHRYVEIECYESVRKMQELQISPKVEKG